MKYLVVLCTLIFCTLQTFSQQEYFIYVQTDNNQPFYIRINNNVYSSSATGSIILSKLADSTAAVTIGFAKNVFPEQRFTIPVNHKDAGYVLKVAGEKGWGLFNLQTQAVILNSHTAEEKKNPEISGSKRSDAFSLLLSNAVNDTAVLYTVAKPVKPVPPPVLVDGDSKKNDTLSIAKKDLPRKDSAVLVKKEPVRRDGSISAKNNLKAQKDSSLPAVRLSRAKEPAAIAKNRKGALDTTAIAVLKTTPQPNNKLPAKTMAAKKDTVVTVKNTPRQRRDTIIISGKTAARNQTPIAKNKKDRRDTIIIMNGKTPDNNKAVAANAALQKEKTPFTITPRDTTQLIKKEILQAPEEKRNALLSSNNAVVIEQVPVKKDSFTNAGAANKDTAPTIVKNETGNVPETKTDTLSNTPAKRLRPMVNKVAELLTDTSYIAVFVDESKEKFDTVRISIPFNEVAAHAHQEKPVARLADTAANKRKNDSLPAAAASLPIAGAVKKDTAVADTVPKNNTALTTALQNTAAAKKTDSLAADKKNTDSAAATAVEQPVLPAVKNDTTVKTTKSNIPDTVIREPAQAVIKKDSVPAPPDSGRLTKAPAQPLFLNSDCKEIATASDIDKLRIKMLLVASDEDRITLAKKLFRQKCFLVLQVKALSELFKTDEGKYKWFDAAYPFVSDTGNFASLSDLIKDDYYLNRFKAMLRH